MFSPLLALPATPFAPLFLIASSMLGSIGFASGSAGRQRAPLPADQRPGRDPPPRALPGAHVGRDDCRPAGGAGVIAVGGRSGYPAFAALYAHFGALRVVAFRQARGRPVSRHSGAPHRIAAAGAASSTGRPALGR